MSVGPRVTVLMHRGPLSAHEPPILVLFAEEVLPDKEPIPDKLELSLGHSGDFRPGGGFFLCPASWLLVSLLGTVWGSWLKPENRSLDLQVPPVRMAPFSGDRLILPLTPPLLSPCHPGRERAGHRHLWLSFSVLEQLATLWSGLSSPFMVF